MAYKTTLEIQVGDIGHLRGFSGHLYNAPVRVVRINRTLTVEFMEDTPPYLAGETLKIQKLNFKKGT